MGGEPGLDFAVWRRKESDVNPRAENFYAAWRENCRAINSLHDGGPTPPEKLLQSVWQHQRLQRDRLQTGDGRPVRVFHPGFISLEGGPDFRGAVLQFGDDAPVTGDVEVDLQPAGWHAHGHDKNPAFKNVVLQVVWDGGSIYPAGGRTGMPAATLTKPEPAVLRLKKVLDAPLAGLALALDHESGLPEGLRGKCSAPLRGLDAGNLAELLQAAARVRFQNKAGAMRARAKVAGWEQVLWENLFRALGYKHNVWPMQNLAETKPRWTRGAHSAFDLQTRLLGISSLLPAELTRTQKSSDTFLRRAWDVWWREREDFAGWILPQAAWKFHGLRPANHPQRRLALAAHWLASGSLVSKLEGWCAAAWADEKLLPSLHAILQVERDEFWSWHWTFKSARLARPQPLLGEARATDLAVNVVLPWLWVRSQEGGSEKIQREIERRFLAWPAAADNSVLKLARQRLLGTSNACRLPGAAAQQGLMQVVRDFCKHSNAICADCRFPELVRGWRAPAVT